MSIGFRGPGGDLTTAWLRRLEPVAEPRVRLVCFPHAGGTAAFYRPWRGHLTPDVELYAVQYPGRLDRIGEACIDDMDVIADAVTAAVLPLTDRPVALFGHSLGAVISYEVARRLPARPARNLARLFVSGRAAPARQRRAALHLASDDVLWGEIGELGGTRAEVLADAELRRAFLPALRSDYRISEIYQPRPGPRLDCAVTALLGDRDGEVIPDDATPWADLTTGAFSMRVFPGEHFYLMSLVREVTDEILRRLDDCLPPVPPGWAGP